MNDGDCGTVTSIKKTNNNNNNEGISCIDKIIRQRLEQRIQRGTVRQLLHSKIRRSTVSVDVDITAAAAAVATIVNQNEHNNHHDSGNDSYSCDSDTTATTTTSLHDSTTTATNGSGGMRETLDFSSNDYLGLARDLEQYRLVEHEMEHHIQKQLQLQQQQQQQQTLYLSTPVLGSTGSRLLSGDSTMVHDLEAYLCQVHNAQSALLCNSGYDANLSVISTLPCTCILYDSYIHNSLHMGIRLWQSSSQHTTNSSNNSNSKSTTKSDMVAASFLHNNVNDLRRQLQYYRRQCGYTVVILIESVYSMDGDIAPVRDILDMAQSYQSFVVVDEAHGFGVFGSNNRNDGGNTMNNTKNSGTGVLAMTRCQSHPALVTAIYTYGKGAGCHGAVICAPHSHAMKEYWINYAYPIIYSTALPLHSIVTIQCSYKTTTSDKGQRLRRHLYQLIDHFQSRVSQILDRLKTSTGSGDSLELRNHPYRLLPSVSPIQALIVPGNRECTQFCQVLFRISEQSVRLFPIKTPTVPIGQERVRIVLHAHNTLEQTNALIHYIDQTLQEMTSANFGQRSKL